MKICPRICLFTVESWLLINSICFKVSNEVPEVPVISPSSGSIFERRLVEKYILENGCDPINGKDMTAEELIEIKSKTFKELYVNKY